MCPDVFNSETVETWYSLVMPIMAVGWPRWCLNAFNSKTVETSPNRLSAFLRKRVSACSAERLLKRQVKVCVQDWCDVSQRVQQQDC